VGWNLLEPSGVPEDSAGGFGVRNYITGYSVARKINNSNNNAYYKASLIKVIQIFVNDIVFNLNIIYKGKLLMNNH